MKNNNWHVCTFLVILFLVGIIEKSLSATNEVILAQLETSSLRFVLYSPTAEHFELVISQLPQAKSKQQVMAKKQKLALIAEAFPLPHPSRLVVDVVGYSSPIQKIVQIQHEHVQALRVGVHRKKTRLVIDLQGSLPTQYQVHNNRDDQTTISFDFGDSQQPSSESDDKATRKNIQETRHSQTRDNETKELAALLNEVSRSTSPLPPQPAVSPKPLDTTPQAENKNERNERNERNEKNASPYREAPVKTSKKNMEQSTRPEILPKNPHLLPSKRPIPEPSTIVKSQKVPQSFLRREGPVDAQEKREEDSSSTPRALNMEHPREEQKDREKETQPPEKLATTEPQITQGAVTQGAIVKSMVFRPVDNGSSAALVIHAEHLGSYSLVRKSDEMYELLLEKIHLKGTHLSLPQFPPDTFQGFQVVVASQRGDNVLVKVYVENRVTLSPSRSGEDLIVRVVGEKR